MAAYRCLCQSRGVLPGRDSSSFSTGICLALEGERALEWIGSRCNCSIFCAFTYNRSHELGGSGERYEFPFIEENLYQVVKS